MAAVVLVEHVLQVADPHVVGLDRQVRTAEALLGEAQVAHRGVRIDLRRIVAAAAQKLEVMRREPVPVLHHRRQNLVHGDVTRHVPERCELDILHRIGEDRRAALFHLVTDDHGHRQRAAPVIVGVERE